MNSWCFPFLLDNDNYNSYSWNYLCGCFHYFFFQRHCAHNVPLVARVICRTESWRINQVITIWIVRRENKDLIDAWLVTCETLSTGLWMLLLTGCFCVWTALRPAGSIYEDPCYKNWNSATSTMLPLVKIVSVFFI